MVSFPNAKINIGLHITGKRADGFHDLQTIFYPVAIKDALEVVEAEAFSFRSSGINIPDTADNLCVRAYHLIKKDYPTLPAVKMHLQKTIPVGAGLGGGSADASFCMQLLDEKFNLHIPSEKMLEYALQLGSDCPFFLINKPCLATGRGEKLTQVTVDLSAYNIIIVNPGIHINTGWAFSQLTNFTTHADLEKAIAQPVSKWKEILFNDFEIPVFNAHPDIAAIKNSLYQNGALYAAMSGSGSSVFGIFTKGSPPVLNFPGNYFSGWL